MWDKIITLLFSQDVNATDENGDTLLHIAVYERNLEAMYYLLGKNANVEQFNKKGNAPIHYAFTDVKMLSCLYAHHANINFPNRNGDTCLNFADEVFFSSETTKREGEEIGKSISFLVEKGAKREITK
jgi:ankyrin repeat protein